MKTITLTEEEYALMCSLLTAISAYQDEEDSEVAVDHLNSIMDIVNDIDDDSILLESITEKFMDQL